MVNPYISRLLDPKTIPIGGEDIFADNVANNHIFLLPNVKADSDEFCET